MASNVAFYLQSLDSYRGTWTVLKEGHHHMTINYCSILRVTSLSWFTQDFSDFSTKSLQSQADRGGWSLRPKSGMVV